MSAPALMPTITSPTVEFSTKVLLGVMAEVDPDANVKVEFGSTFSPANAYVPQRLRYYH
jgi:hypothetical protein